MLGVGCHCPTLAPRPTRCLELPSSSHQHHKAAGHSEGTSTIMASNVEQSTFFQQRRAKDELIVKGQCNATAAGAPLMHIDPPKFDLESYIANYAGTSTSTSLPVSLPYRRALTQTQAARESTASITSARTRRTSPSMRTAWPLPRQRRAKTSTSTCNWRRS